MRAEEGQERVRTRSCASSRIADARRPVRTITPRGEFNFIESVRRRAEKHNRTLADSFSALNPHPSALPFIGDDAAVITQRTGYETVITADLLVEEIDFRRHYTPACTFGRKALAVSLSDI